MSMNSHNDKQLVIVKLQDLQVHSRNEIHSSNKTGVPLEVDESVLELIFFFSNRF